MSSNEDSTSSVMTIEIGPAHPAMHGIVRFTTQLDGELIVGMETEIGYLHRGFEKESENSKWIQVIPYTDRLNYVSPLLNNIGYSMAVEKLYGIEAPRRAEFTRVIMGEISRITDHLTCLAAVAMEIGGFTFFLWAIKAREYLWELVEEMTGARLTTNWTRFGGNSTDLPDGFLSELSDRLIKLKDVMAECDKLLTRNKIFIDRVKDVGCFSKEDALSFGFTGPLLRACGIPYDVRRADPYSVYNELDFEIPVGSTGDCFDRYLVRMEEIQQSIKIIEQAADKLPEGPYMTDERMLRYPDKKDVYGNIEGLIDHFKLVMEGHQPPAGEIYMPIEGGNGEVGFYLVSDGSGDPVRVRLRPPCLNLVEAMPSMTIGHYVADIVAIFGSINMIGGELDR
ncbi:MAG: NADH-quinone oxidoreductase subunit D [SAR324 cluster bacterium]|nr:NADH-quinone oxidoreductase subunit D [SAR324 cluster bacterium]MBL7035053.1 NADH-quinone oxidoreductase subunit D [SAR324 cluster bacterium]